MVFKIAGWIISFEQARTWFDGQEYKHDHFGDDFVGIALNRWFEERDIDYLWAVVTDYPRGSRHAVIVLVRRRREDPKSTVSHYYRVRELDADREVKKQVMEETGLSDEDLPWVTVVDPFFMN
ncbi:uncharacterized protein HD556DRAFT_1365284 [Suillus plorans]|uniref:Uncharacterized protein n=1 Tax=Suillus plorans TaxID=116603 RepID=A0A9P7DJE7_9AGAM|nr:uncharacterized protein HD556DRAFT_1365284 [Suillus plorans]KAG1795410.1 hypothetical protein HD556DRAFT_1365284 [Suillus plorans]